MGRQSVGFVSIGRSIFPIIKSVDDTDIERAERRGKPLITTEIAEGLVVCYVRETVENLELVTDAHLRPFLMTREDIIKAAKRNLAERVRDSARIRTVNPEGESAGLKPFYRGIIDKKFDTSLMVVDEFWERAEEMLGSSEIVVGIPSRNALLFCDLKVAESLDALRPAAHKMFEEGAKDNNQLTSQLYIRREGSWTLWKNDD